MARIEGVDLPRNKRVEVGLTYLFGVGPTRSHQILAATKVNPDTRIKDLTEAEVTAIREFVQKNYKLEGDLRRETQHDVVKDIIAADLIAGTNTCTIACHFFTNSSTLRRQAVCTVSPPRTSLVPDRARAPSGRRDKRNRQRCRGRGTACRPPS